MVLPFDTFGIRIKEGNAWRRKYVDKVQMSFKFMEVPMKLYMLFAVIDLLILLAYPIVYIVHQVRKMMGSKQ